MGPFTCASCRAEIAQEARDCAACGKPVVPAGYFRLAAGWRNPFRRIQHAPDAEFRGYVSSVMMRSLWSAIVFGAVCMVVGAVSAWGFTRLIGRVEDMIPHLQEQLYTEGVRGWVREDYLGLWGSVTEFIRVMRIGAWVGVIFGAFTTFEAARVLVVTRRLLAMIPAAPAGTPSAPPSPTPPAPAPPA
jgi:hypothetical protein